MELVTWNSRLGTWNCGGVRAIAYSTVLTLPIRDVLPATPRARIVRINLNGGVLDYAAGQAVLIGTPGAELRKPYSIPSSPEDGTPDRFRETLICVRAEGMAGPHRTCRSR